MARPDVTIQLGHCYRKSGSTGTAGMWQGRKRTEQEYVSKVGYRMAEHLNAAGIVTKVVLADDPIPSSLVFVALHQDGSENRTARGASVGYPTDGLGRQLGQTWKALYQLGGWPSGFRDDNYTRALRTYYGFRRSDARAKLLIEHGFATNLDDQRWMWNRWADVARINAEAVAHHLGRSLTDTEEQAMILMHDTDSDTWRVAVPGEGSAVIDSPEHWASVIAAGRKTGVYSSRYMSNLIDKIRAERA